MKFELGYTIGFQGKGYLWLGSDELGIYVSAYNIKELIKCWKEKIRRLFEYE